MAIQINEKKLSFEAVKALNNAKNKSQFLRDAIEYYVKTINETEKLEEDIKEIKEILIKMSLQKPIDTKNKDTNIKANNIDLNLIDKENEEKRKIESMIDDSIENFI